MATRRGFLKSAGTAGAVLVGGAASSETTTAAHTRQIPDYLHITFPRDELRTYQPKLELAAEDAEKFMDTVAWKVSSSEYQYDVLIYFNRYTHQDGASPYTSHWGDREPIYLFINDRGEIEQDRFSAYHWYAGGGYGVPTGPDGHPLYHVVTPHHHHFRISDATGTELTTLEPLGTRDTLEDPETNTAFETMLANGLEGALAEGVVTNAEKMLTRPHWWASNYGPISTTALRVMAAYYSGQDKAEQVNPRDITPF